MGGLFQVLVLLVSVASGSPVRRQRDLLTGSDFLAVFMRSSTDHYYTNNDLFNRDNHASEYEHEDYKLADIEINKEYQLPRETLVESTTPAAAVQSTTVAEQTTTEDATTGTSLEEVEDWQATEKPLQVVSVRVSSSVVRSRPTEGRGTPLPVLSTQDQPSLRAAAVQRSHFGVEEASRSVSYSPPETPEEHKVVTYSEEHTVYRVEGRQSKFQRVGDRAGVGDSLPSASASQAYTSRAEIVNPGPGPKPGEAEARVEPDRRDYVKAEALTYQVETDPQKAPVSYQTSVSSATSGSRVQFYREPPSYNRPELPTQPPSRSFRPQNPDKSGPEPEKNYEEPERVYGQPEQNYEVDEAVSVMTNGRAHGVQGDPDEDDEKKEEENQKFGYVLEGRNYKKYVVEERTPDGFIVGEYGVVSHDDGSLRGVRYTADSTINPRLIYDALVKFLSLK